MRFHLRRRGESTTMDIKGRMFAGDPDMFTTANASDLVLSPDMAGTLMTPEEFDAAEVDPDDGSRYELIHGVLVVTPIPADAEVGPNELLGHWLLHAADELE